MVFFILIYLFDNLRHLQPIYEMHLHQEIQGKLQKVRDYRHDDKWIIYSL
jgi:hypothetical protein